MMGLQRVALAFITICFMQLKAEFGHSKEFDATFAVCKTHFCNTKDIFARRHKNGNRDYDFDICYDSLTTRYFLAKSFWDSNPKQCDGFHTSSAGRHQTVGGLLPGEALEQLFAPHHSSLVCICSKVNGFFRFWSKTNSVDVITPSNTLSLLLKKKKEKKRKQPSLGEGWFSKNHLGAKTQSSTVY